MEQNEQKQNLPEIEDIYQLRDICQNQPEIKEAIEKKLIDDYKTFKKVTTCCQYSFLKHIYKLYPKLREHAKKLILENNDYFKNLFSESMFLETCINIFPEIKKDIEEKLMNSSENFHRIAFNGAALNIVLEVFPNFKENLSRKISEKIKDNSSIFDENDFKGTFFQRLPTEIIQSIKKADRQNLIENLKRNLNYIEKTSESYKSYMKYM